MYAFEIITAIDFSIFLPDPIVFENAIYNVCICVRLYLLVAVATSFTYNTSSFTYFYWQLLLWPVFCFTYCYLILLQTSH